MSRRNLYVDRICYGYSQLTVGSICWTPILCRVSGLASASSSFSISHEEPPRLRPDPSVSPDPAAFSSALNTETSVAWLDVSSERMPVHQCESMCKHCTIYLCYQQINTRAHTHSRYVLSLSLSHANTHVHVYVIRTEEHIGVLGCFWDIRAKDTFILLTKTSNCFDWWGTVKEQGTICGH